MKKPSISVTTSKHLERLAEMEQTVAEQDSSLSSLTDRLNAANAELGRHRDEMAMQEKEHAQEWSK